MFLQSLKMAWESIRSNRMRSFLTMLGIIIGVFSLVVLVSIVSGATGSITDQISSMGSDALIVNIADDKGKPLKYSELKEIEDLESVDQVTPYVAQMASMKSGSRTENGYVYGVDASYFSIADENLSAGRFLTNADCSNNSYVAVVSQEVVESVIGTQSPANAIGMTITIMRHPVTIVGVLNTDDMDEAQQQRAQMMGMGGCTVLMPYQTLQRMASNASDITGFMVSADSDLARAEQEVGDWLMERFDDDQDAYYIVNFEQVMSVLGNVTSTMSFIMGGVAAISLLVGGIGIMNIMLVSVTERTKEIGIRKAIGASRSSILVQFLIEAMMISVIGCFLGVVLSGIALELINDFWGKITFHLEPGVVVLATAFSLGIGLIFGIYPANKAAKKNPIDALHYGG